MFSNEKLTLFLEPLGLPAPTLFLEGVDMAPTNFLTPIARASVFFLASVVLNDFFIFLKPLLNLESVNPKEVSAINLPSFLFCLC